MKVNYIYDENQQEKPRDDSKKLSPSDYQTHKLYTNPKDEKSTVYNLVIAYYKVGTPEEWL
eukprot:2159621-Ditylum_brightwellii.AAC.1